MTHTTRLSYDRAPWYFSLLLLAGVLGFYRSYFSILGQVDLAHHLHGITATAWMILLITQGWLVRGRRLARHRFVGRSAYVLAPLFLLSGAFMVKVMLSNTDPFSLTYGKRLAFVDITTLAYFAAAVALALVHRRQVHLHARYMACTGIMILPPALARLVAGFVHGPARFPIGFHASYVIADAIVVLLLVHDARTGGIRAPYALLLALLLVQQFGFVVMGG